MNKILLFFYRFMSMNLAGLFLFICSLSAAAQAPSGPELSSLMPSQEYRQGMIVIKVKEGLGPYAKQLGNVSFDAPALDFLVEKYKVHALTKRFKHRPIPKDSGLPDLGRIYTVEFSPEFSVLEVAAGFAKDPDIEYAEPWLLGQVTEEPDDPLYGSQPYLPQIMAPEAWDIHKGEDGEEVVVALVDTGIDWKHPDLADNAWQNLGEDADGDGATLEYDGSEWIRDPDDLNGIDDDGNGYVDDVIGWDFHEEAVIGDGSNPDPIWYQGPYDHGTHCAGIAAATTNNGIGISSVSWNIKHMAVQTDNGNNTVMYGIDGVIYAAENGADVISNSWYHGYGYSQYEYEAMQYAIGLGSIVCFAAANNNTTRVALPAGYPGVISIAAVALSDAKASFSNYGISVDLSSPGVLINSTLPNSGYGAKSGTSMACPMAAGLFGLVKSYHPEWSNEELIAQVLGTADDIDSLNPGFVNALGDGRINAYHALADENVIPPQELKLEFTGYSMEDESGDGTFDPMETGTINLQLRNYATLTGSDEVVLTLSTFDPEITIDTPTEVVSIAPDSDQELTGLFGFTVNENSSAHLALFLITVTADVAVTYGQEMLVSVVVAPSGFFVWDAEVNVPGYSGSYIKEFLESQGHDVLYSSHYPNSFNGFDGVFLSFGNAGEGELQGTLFDYSHSLPVQEYLGNGGSVYIEGMALMGVPEYYGYPNAVEWQTLFGVSSASFGFVSNPIGNLEGQAGTLAEGMLFTESSQSNNWYIDKIVPQAGAYCPFYEDGYGNVSVYYEGNEGHKAFYFGYNLADLVDAGPHSSRYNLLLKVMDFFGYPMGEDVLEANFNVSKTDVQPGEEIQFTDFSISAEDDPVTSWAWDFDADGWIDSEEQDPSWFYPSGGFYDVMLVVSNSQSTDTLVRHDLVLVRAGILVYEGEPGGIDQSGTFIRDYLVDNGYEVSYTNQFPASLEGFDAVFASFGSSAYTSPVLNEPMTNTLKAYLQGGGMAYLEGSEALGQDQQGDNFLWFLFGLEDVANGATNPIDAMVGQEASIMEGMEFSSSTQLDVSGIDIYETFAAAPTAIPAFAESEYGTVAVQFNGEDFFGQRTFCMSYSLANLEDGNPPNTREEFLFRILNFFDITTDVARSPEPSNDKVRVYPNPAGDHVVVEFDTGETSVVAIEIFDLWGQRVVNAVAPSAGSVSLDTRHLSPGTYFYKVSSGQMLQTGKLIIAH